MNPGIVSAAVVVVGAIAAALYYVFNEPPQAQSHSNRNRETVNNFNFNTISTNNYYPPGKSSKTENESRNRKKPRRRVMMKNDKCGICLDHLTGDVEILSCEHAYHVKCLEAYSESEKKSNAGKLRCPLCRQSID